MCMDVLFVCYVFVPLVELELQKALNSIWLLETLFRSSERAMLLTAVPRHVDF